MVKRHIINKQTGHMGNFYRKRTFFEKHFRIPIPMTLCGLKGIRMPKGEGVSSTENCNCELCLQVNDNVEQPDI